jgi:flagellar motor switch protein FliG
MRALALIVVLAASPAFATVTTDAERNQAAARLADVAQRALDGILGPGRSQVRVEVQGDTSEIDSATESVLPIVRHEQADLKPAHLLDLPGYGKAPPPEPPKEKTEQDSKFYQKDQEHSFHDAGFQIKSIQATVIFDTALDTGSVRDAAQLLPQLLKLDTPRGDTLTLLSAPLRPAWKAAFATPGDWRSAAYAAGGALVFLLTVLIGGLCLIMAGRALGRALGQELGGKGRDGEPETPPDSDLLPDLTEGAGGLLDVDAEAGEGAAETPLLGRRFDFLNGSDQNVIASALAAEKPADLSLFFGHLAGSIPDLASRLFALLSPSVQAEVSTSLIKLSIADPERLGEIEERLKNAVDNGVIGTQSLGRILSRVPEDARANLLDRLAASDARGAREVERHLFSFEHLAGIGVAPLRRLLGAVPYEAWGTALRGAPAPLIEQVLADLPEGPREMVREAIGTPQPREKVAEARSQILDALSALTASGDVVLERKETQGDLV